MLVLLQLKKLRKLLLKKKIDPKKDIMNEVNLILRGYIITLMKPLENENFFDKKEKLNAVLVSGLMGLEKQQLLEKLVKF